MPTNQHPRIFDSISYGSGMRQPRLLPINANALAHFNINWVWHLAAKRFLTFRH
jgi:hypothetical protein